MNLIKLKGDFENMMFLKNAVQILNDQIILKISVESNFSKTDKISMSILSTIYYNFLKKTVNPNQKKYKINLFTHEAMLLYDALIFYVQNNDFTNPKKYIANKYKDEINQQLTNNNLTIYKTQNYG